MRRGIARWERSDQRAKKKKKEDNKGDILVITLNLASIFFQR